MVNRLLALVGLKGDPVSRLPLPEVCRQLTKAFALGFGLRLSRLHPPPSVPAPRRVAHAHYRGRRFLCFRDNFLGDTILSGEIWDAELVWILRDLASSFDDGAIVEIGANIGASLVPLADQFPMFTFHCVEPVAEFFKLLQENAATYSEGRPPNVHLYRTAVGATTAEQLVLHIQRETAGALPHYDNHERMASESFAAQTIDSLFGNLDVRLLKIDVDGYELEVLQGAGAVLDRCRPACFLEFSTRLMRARGVDPESITREFERRGYDRIRIFEAQRLVADSRRIADAIRAADEARYYVDVYIECTSLQRRPSAL
jgi:FkbM family methyltransferase